MRGEQKCETISFGNPEGKKPLGRLKRGWGDNVTFDQYQTILGIDHYWTIPGITKYLKSTSGMNGTLSP